MTNEWLAYGFVFLLGTPIIGLICRRWVTVAWAAGAIAMLLIGTVT